MIYLDKKKIQAKTVIFGLGIFLALYLLVVSVAIYVFDSDNGLVQKTEKFLPYPVANWGMNFISVAHLKANLDSAKRFYEKQDFSDLGLRVDFVTEDGKKRLKIKEKNILNKLIEDGVIEKEAVKRGIVLRSEDVSQEVSRKMQEYGSEEFLKNNLAKLYGWDVADFENNIVKPDMYRERLALNLRKNDSKSVVAKNKIKSALEDLQSGKTFEDTVQKYSEGDSAKNGGKVGWFSAGEMLPEIAKAIFELKKGERTDVVESQLGYHIVLMVDRKTENEVDSFELKQIFVRTPSFSDWLFEIEKNMDVRILSRDFYWNKANGQVEFRNPELKKFEENLRENSPGDISVLF